MLGQVAQLRALIGATADKGYLLGSEPLPRRAGCLSTFFFAWTSRGAEATVVLQRSHFEAAARLWMHEEFDPSQFDALCVCLEVHMWLEIHGLALSSYCTTLS